MRGKAGTYVDNQEQLEAVAYHQRLAHKAWLNKAFTQGMSPTDEVTELVWELLLAYGEAGDDVDQVLEDIHRIAYELAAMHIPQMPLRDVYKYFRDNLLDAMVDFERHDSHKRCRALVHFANEVSTAISEANTDHLKRDMRRRRAENLSNELTLAKRIQRHLLPKVVPSIPGFEFAGRLLPAQEIGGDYWSIKHDANRGIVTLKLADITGHGLAAATLVAAVKFISGGFYQGSASAAEVMKKTNRVLARETPHDIMVTMAYGWLRPGTRELTLVNAGHSPVFLCQKDSCTDIAPTGPVLGLNEDSDYGEVTFELAENDILFFGSDGITEADVKNQFGAERLKEVVFEHKSESANSIADAVLRAVTEHVAVQHDDVSLLVVKVTGDSTESP